MTIQHLSVCIITFNEEDNIERCINSVVDLADEIIVLDSFSTDNTQNICEKNSKVTFLQKDFDGYVNQKNYALSCANYSYVLSIDADEEVSETLKASILGLKEKGFTEAAYSFNRLNSYCDQWIKHSGWYPDKKVRIIDRGKCEWGGIDPHDKIIVPTGEKILHLQGDLLHYTYKDIHHHINSLNKFTTIAAEQAFKLGKRSSVLKVSVYPFLIFLKKYFIQLGFLDGYPGFLVCISSAYYRHLKYAKLRELNRKAKK